LDQVVDPFLADMIECLPHLRAFARLLARDPSRAEDLVQDTVVRAISCREQFQPGTNLRGWLITILRNWYFNDARRIAIRAARSPEILELDQRRSGGQEEHMEFRDLKRAFDKLPEVQREALLLVCVNGFSYEEAGQIAGCAVGTMKSRVSRARRDLKSALTEEFPVENATTGGATGAQTLSSPPLRRVATGGVAPLLPAAMVCARRTPAGIARGHAHMGGIG
jgi:RNA polymerase sigma-70 factor (ECF subfamily)